QSIELLRLGRRSLINPRIQIDHVDAGPAGGREVDHNIALAVEPARITHVGVVVRDRVDIVVLGPTYALQMDADLSTGRSRGWRHLYDARFNGEMGTRDRFITTLQRQRVQTAKIVRDGEG